MGGIMGGVFYSKIGLHILVFAAIILILGLIHDTIKLKLILLKRKYTTKNI